MMLELVDSSRWTGGGMFCVTYYRILFPAPAIKPYGRLRSENVTGAKKRNAYVCHKSITVNLSLSIRRRITLGKP